MPADDSQQSNRRNGESVPPGDDVILSEATAAPGRPEPVPATPLTPHDLATPYVLDALTPDEREAYEEHLAGCGICRQRVSELETIAGLLPDALVTPPADLPDAYPYLLRDVAHEILPLSASMPQPARAPEAEPVQPGFSEAEEIEPIGIGPTVPRLYEPSAPHTGALPPVDELADATDEFGYDEDEEREVAGAAANVAPETAAAEQDEVFDELPADDLPETEDDEEEPVVTPPSRRSRPPGRIRPGVRPTGEYAVAAEPARPSGFSSPVIIAFAVLGVIAIGLFLWALLLQGRVNDLEDEVAQQNTEIASLRQQANATAYTLSPTIDGPPAASGTFFFSLPDQRGALVVRGLEAAPEGQAYQLWYIEDEGSTPIAGPTFQVNAGGEAVVPLTAEVSTFDAIAISLEPAEGSDAPTTSLLLQGRLGGAAG